MSTAQQFSRPGEGMLTFGPCALNLASAQLTRDGRVVPLTPKRTRPPLPGRARRPSRDETGAARRLLWPEVFVGDAACYKDAPGALRDLLAVRTIARLTDPRCSATGPPTRRAWTRPRISCCASAPSCTWNGSGTRTS